MLKVLPSSVYNGTANAKCGEIFCHSSKDFTILCTLCEMKSFNYGDFLLHFQNVHFENELLKTDQAGVECMPYLDVSLKCELDVPDHDDYDFQWVDNASPEPAPKEEPLGLRLMNWQNKEQIEDDSDGEEYKPQDMPKPKKESTDYKCEHCDRFYKSYTNLSKHMKKAHAQDSAGAQVPPLQKCHECAEEYTTLKRLEEHCVAVHGGIQCVQCERKFNCKQNMLRHAERHKYGDQRTFVCDFEDCRKSFFTLRQLSAHKKGHTGPKNFVCDVCGYSCRVLMMLTVHYRTHTGEKPYVCKECGKCFRSSCLLKEHSAMHTSARPHVCADCGASFGRQKALYHHKFLHLGIKKFKCKICGNAYAQLAGLAGHMRKHREEGGLCRREPSIDFIKSVLVDDELK